MKEIIEKIKQLRNKPYSEYERLAHNKAIDDILRLIEEEENKPFDPEDLGFKLTADSKVFSSDFVGRFEYYGANYKIRYFKKEGKIWIVDLNTGKLVCDLIKIPSHRFGVELLKNLGVA